MRIIAGEFRGHRITAPKGTSTRPTTDRVRESLFSTLVSLAGPRLGEGPVLDAFAGSGALGLEAISRGAARVTLVERDRKALQALRANIAALRVESRSRVVEGDVFSLAGRLTGGPFALILLDPPYTLDPGRIASWLTTIAVAGKVSDGALITWEHAAEGDTTWPSGYTPIAKKRYGTTAIDFARYEREAGDQ